MPSKKDEYNPFLRIAEALGIAKKKLKALNTDFSMFFTVEAGIKVDLKGSKLTIGQMTNGLRVLEGIFSNYKIMFEASDRAYKIKVIPVIKQALGNSASLSRGGTGVSSEVADRLVGKSFHSNQDLGKSWSKIYKQLLSPIREISPGKFGSFDFKDILKEKIKTKNSKFNNVYYLVEFGTGDQANPGPRRYISLGATPFKISTDYAAVFGGKTSWWVTTVRTLNAYRARLAIFKDPNTTPAKREELSTHAFAFSFGRKGPSSIKARNAIFNKRGMVAKLRDAYLSAQKLALEYIEEELIQRVPFWPKGSLKSVNPSISYNFEIPKPNPSPPGNTIN